MRADDLAIEARKLVARAGAELVGIVDVVAPFVRDGEVCSKVVEADGDPGDPGAAPVARPALAEVRVPSLDVDRDPPSPRELREVVGRRRAPTALDAV